MPRSTLLFPMLLLLVSASLLFTGCNTTCESVAVAEPAQHHHDHEAVGGEPDADKDAEADKAKENKIREIEELERDLASKERDLELKRLHLEKAEMVAQHAADKNAMAIAAAEFDLRTARDKFSSFKSNMAPQRIKNSELSLKRSNDRLTESRQELEQLEMLYAEEEFADKTKEIVLDRARSRLERSQEMHSLLEKDNQILLSFTLPHEHMVLEHDVLLKEESLRKAQMSAAESEMGQQISILSAKFDIVSAEIQLEVHKEKIERKRAELEE